MKHSITECLSQIQDLTKKNLEILKGINDSFFTKQNHLSVNIGEDKFVIPSFISLENKINALEENFTNLINSPKQGEAYFNLNGNHRAIEVKSYTQTPNSVELTDDIKSFSVLQNDIFKDFLTPIPKVTFNLNTVPNDITSVNVKKIIPLNNELKDKFANILTKIEKDEKTGKDVVVEIPSKQVPYGDVFKMVSIYKEDVDYIEYDTVYKMPIRTGVGSGSYIIQSVLSDVVDNDLNNIISVEVDNLTYKLFDETIEKPLAVGDYLTTFDGSAKLQIVEIIPSVKRLNLIVLNGEYTNFVGIDTYDSSKHISDLSRLKFFSPIDFDKDKYVDVPLEEDQYVFIAISPLNDKMNLQAPWGTGMMLNTYKLYLESNTTKKFNEYYRNNVKNIGDIIYEISNILSTNTLSKLTTGEFEAYSNFKPTINMNDMIVTKINSHLSASPTVENIRGLYSQKKRLQSEAAQLDSKINELSEQLEKSGTTQKAKISANIKVQRKNRIDIDNKINNIVNSISKAVNDSEVPLENAKYRIRGFYNYLAEDLIKDHVIGVKVRYRYKNITKKVGSTLAISGSNNTQFVYTDWNDMTSIKKVRYPKLDESGNLVTAWEADNFNVNEPSISQIDIPISQGESVDVKIKVIYDFGSPFVETSSMWSDVVNFEFPTEFIEDIEVLDIIEENNNDIENNRIYNILADKGITSHVEDKVYSDGDKVYFHNANNIPSGFKNTSGDIVSLYEKLKSLSDTLESLTSEVYGQPNSTLKVSLKTGDNKALTLKSWEDNTFVVRPYSRIKDQLSEGSVSGYELLNNGIIRASINMEFTNETSAPIKVYPLFPGNSSSGLVNSLRGKYNAFDYCFKENTAGVWIKNLSSNAGSLNLQTNNQFVTFRVYDIETGSLLYSDLKESDFASKGGFAGNMLSRYKSTSQLSTATTAGSTIYGSSLIPCTSSKFNSALLAEKSQRTGHIGSSSYTKHYEVAPNSTITIPLLFEYKLDDKTVNYTNKTLSFDIRTSLYNEPTNYTFTICARYEDIEIDRLNEMIDTTVAKYNSVIA